MNSQITILKFGSSILRSEDDLPVAVHEIYRRWRGGERVLIVVSAFGETTDCLLRQAESFCSEPDDSIVAALLATGEARSAALLGLALQKSGVAAKVLSPAQVGLKTAGDKLDGEPVAVKVEKLCAELETAIVIVSGFVGQTETGDLTLLGRGGSDFTALFLAKELGAKCVLLKDFAGLYESDPASAFARPRRFTRANWQTALQVGGKVVQPKAVCFAEKHRLKFYISAPNSAAQTEIGGGTNEFAASDNSGKPLKVALLGCGTVGGGVYQRLAALPDFFEIVGVSDRHRAKTLAAGVPESLLIENPADLIERDCDAVVELFGKIEPTIDLVKYALQLKRNVVSANKALFAAEGVNLEKLARERGARICLSAAVGGAMPALEIVEHLRGKIRSVSGIVNGTCNFICDELAKNSDFDAAVRAAQIAGFAEADPTLDLNGTDAAQKMILLARQAFGANLSLADIDRKGIENLDSKTLRRAIEKGLVVRLIAECRQTAGKISASVKPVELPATHPFAIVQGAQNCLKIETTDGKIKFTRGRGAGREATTEAVLADLFDLWRETAAAKSFVKFAAGTAEVTR